MDLSLDLHDKKKEQILTGCSLTTTYMMMVVLVLVLVVMMNFKEKGY